MEELSERTLMNVPTGECNDCSYHRLDGYGGHHCLYDSFFCPSDEDLPILQDKNIAAPQLVTMQCFQQRL